ncbi:protein-disulfide reductase DsbD [Pseudaminobacter arsenicus]|uniref:Protein-disulfide reductase DsbD n=1 Tax=Borborobacter arsenicus TaxID=1851146 RepID=A0A432V3N1_9HYPH|nr:protein-disulfide reductase DsbD [Pseudaminobacter arsenicus]RUM96766.1 protein-disulfide reductase DsbD [Pseudaminobacter arsenicus]
MRFIVSALIALFLSAGAASSQQPVAPLDVDDAFALSVARVGEKLELRWNIAPGYYLYRDNFTITQGATDVPFTVSEGVAKDDPGFGNVEVIFDEAIVDLTPAAGEPVRVDYQGCQDGGICYRPEARVVAPDTLVVTKPVGGFIAPVAGDVSLAASGIVIADDAGDTSSILEGSSVAWIMLSFLGFGLLLAFTPCVFPIYPIVIGMLGRQGERTTAARGFALSTTYVLGLAVAFGLVGAIVGWSGQNIQFALQSPLTTAAIAALFLILASSMLGAFELQLPSGLTSRFAGRSGGGSLGSAGALGFTSALIVGPCVTAPLAGALVYIAQGGDWRIGALALFSLGFGKGLPLIAMATFGGGLLPRAGRWMEEIKRLFGFGFIATAIWVATPLLPIAMDLSLYALLLIVAAVDLVLRISSRRAKAAAMGLTLLAGILALGAIDGNGKPMQAMARIVLRSAPPAGSDLTFTTTASREGLLRAFEAAGEKAQPLMLYVTADWCVICRTIERKVLPDKGVAKALDGVHLVKFDVSEFDAAAQAVLKELKIAGPPTMVFFDSSRRERSGTRLIGSVASSDLIQSATALKR